MSTSVIAANTFEAACVGGPKAVDGGTSFDLVKAFGGRVFSIAKHITQNDDAAEDVLIETFLEVCPDLGGCQEDEESWLRLVTLAVRGAFSKLHNRGEGRPFLDPVADPCEDLVIREFFVWGDNYQQGYSSERATCVLEHGLRSLDPMCRTVFVLRDIEEISVENIAKTVNRSVAAVEVCLLRARLQLREMLAQQTRHQT